MKMKLNQKYNNFKLMKKNKQKFNKDFNKN